jgi:hypothetical protein
MTTEPTDPSDFNRPPPSLASGHPSRGTDRRRRATPRFSRYSFVGGRRREVRRGHEAEGTYVDLYGAKLLLALLWVALMNVGDSFFTLVHLQAGGIELNPIAEQLLETGRFGFVFWKCLLIGMALFVLALHKNFRLARVGIWVAAGSYTLLVGYHLLLFRI